MTIDRRGFLYAGGLAATAGSLLTAAHATAAHAAMGGHSLATFGVEPNAERDQTAALQKALDELTRAGQAMILPAGSFATGPLKLPKGATVIGVPGLTVLRAKSAGPLLGGTDFGTVHLSGVTFAGPDTKGAAALLSVADAAVSMVHCRFSGSATMGARLDNCSGFVGAIEIAGGMTVGISATRAAGLTVSGCRIAFCDGAGIAVSGTGGDVEGFTVGQNHLGNCANGIAADGTGIVTGNVVTGSSRFGLRLGKAGGQGDVMAQSNLLRGCRIGIGVASSGDDIMCSLNMIAGAKESAIRAFDGDKLVGPDLARQSAEAYLNLMVAGNVVR